MDQDDVEAQATSQAQELAGLALQCAAIAGSRIGDMKERIKDYASREPMRALGIAFGVGLAIGWCIKRR
jgi:ElaB/YqjD/DUF883 family membrane-anchored ribosome-binding protein